MKKVAIFIPNLSFAGSGGAEAFGIGIAEVLSENCDVTIYTRYNPAPEADISRIYEKYGTKCFKTRYIKMLSVGYKHIFLKDLLEIQLNQMRAEIDKSFDIFINCTQGKLPGCKNIPSIHIIHFPDKPYTNKPLKILGTIIDDRYLKSYKLFLANSEFTKKWFTNYWGRECKVLNPPSRLASDDCSWDSKEKIIIAVGRIIPEKCILEMITAYKELVEKHNCKYKFVIIGNTHEKYKWYSRQIEKSSCGYNIELLKNVSFEELCGWYKKAQIFWHAKGYGVEDCDPFLMEHFGMTTVEAMSFGCVPIVINKGGQTEIVDDGINGKRWNTIPELVQMTCNVIHDEGKMQELSKNAIQKVKKYQMSNFKNNVTELLKDYL